MSVDGPTRAERRGLRGGITGFSAVLPSRAPGIHFTATITATVYPECLPALDWSDTARLVRVTLRTAAADVARRRDPADLPGAQDACAHHLAQLHDLPGPHRGAVRGFIDLGLDEDAVAAVSTLTTARQQQGVRDAVLLLQLRSRANALTDPALLAASVGLQGEGLFEVTSDVAALKKRAALFENLRSAEDDPVEYRMLEIVRSFLGTFERHDQKQMLITVLASAMRAAKQGEHATAMEELARDDTDRAGA